MIVVPSWGNVTLIEVIWTLPPFIGLYYSMLTVAHARLFLNAARQGGDEASIIDTYRDVRNEVARLRMQLLFVVVGVIAMSMPEAFGRPAYLTSLRLFITVLFLVVPFDTLRISMLDRRDRERRDILLAERRKARRGAQDQLSARRRPEDAGGSGTRGQASPNAGGDAE